jgi:hypothetical protein
MSAEIIKKNEKTENYLNSTIVSWENHWNEFNDVKQRMESKKEIICHIYRIGSKWQPLNLGECNDGGKFTAVNQAINQAKEFVDVCIKNNYQ